MELRQLAYFVAVAEEAGFTRAADRLHVAQPGISAQVRRLERELGQELLDRSGRTVRLTDAGAAVLPYARAALAAVDGARRTVDELTGLVRGRVAIGAVTSHSVDLPALLADFHRDHPDVEITLTEDRSDLLVEGVRSGRLDTAIIAYGGPTPTGLAAHLISDEAIHSAVAPHDPLARRASVPLTALRERVLICLPHGTGIRSVLDTACAAAGFTPRIAFEAGSPLVLAELAARGLGVAIVPESVATSRDDLRAVPVTQPELRGRLSLVWRSEGPVSPAARALTARVRRVLAGTEARGPHDRNGTA